MIMGASRSGHPTGGTVSGFLKEVLSLKNRDVAEAQAQISLKEVRAAAEREENESLKRAATDPTEAAKRLRSSFLHAMEQSRPGRAGIIAEIKKASPSKGDIRVDLNPAKYAKNYTQAGATAISVLTESHYFKGTLDDLKTVRAATPLPVLRKDFTLSAYQIYEARAAGANAILLIVTMLSKEQLRDYAALTRELGMEPLVEIHSEWELDNAMFADAKVIGINNRNLQTLKTDTTVARRVVPFFTKDQIAVEASGISSPNEILKGMESKIFNFLVGESIVRAENTRAFVHSLVTAGVADEEIDDSISEHGEGQIEDEDQMGEKKSGDKLKDEIDTDTLLNTTRFFKTGNKSARVKICGLTTVKEAMACVEAGADAIGFVFYPKSPRHLTIEQAADIAKSLPMDVMTTGVFVDESVDFIMERVRACHLKAVQLHGNESPDMIRRLKSNGLIVIKALFAAREPYLDQAGEYHEAHAILVEYGKGVLPGGNAEHWNWKLARDAVLAQEKKKEGIAEKESRLPKLIVAGGLTPENIASAVKLAGPWGVDLSSGVETSPGRKDIGKVKALMSQLRP